MADQIKQLSLRQRVEAYRKECPDVDWPTIHWRGPICHWRSFTKCMQGTSDVVPVPHADVIAERPGAEWVPMKKAGRPLQEGSHICFRCPDPRSPNKESKYYGFSVMRMTLCCRGQLPADPWQLLKNVHTNFLNCSGADLSDLQCLTKFVPPPLLLEKDEGSDEQLVRFEIPMLATGQGAKGWTDHDEVAWQEVHVHLEEASEGTPETFFHDAELLWQVKEDEYADSPDVLLLQPLASPNDAQQDYITTGFGWIRFAEQQPDYRSLVVFANGAAVYRCTPEQNRHMQLALTGQHTPSLMPIPLFLCNDKGFLVLHAVQIVMNADEQVQHEVCWLDLNHLSYGMSQEYGGFATIFEHEDQDLDSNALHWICMSAGPSTPRHTDSETEEGEQQQQTMQVNHLKLAEQRERQREQQEQLPLVHAMLQLLRKAEPAYAPAKHACESLAELFRGMAESDHVVYLLHQLVAQLSAGGQQQQGNETKTD